MIATVTLLLVAAATPEGPPPAPRLVLDWQWSRMAEAEGRFGEERSAGEGGGQNTSVESARFSPDGSLIVTGSKLDNSVRLFDLDGNPGWVTHHDAEIERAGFTRDGRFVLSGAEDGLVRVIDVATGGTVHTLPHGAGIDALRVSPDGRLLVTGTERREEVDVPDDQRDERAREARPGIYAGPDLGRGDGLNVWAIDADDPAAWTHLLHLKPDPHEPGEKTDVNGIDFTADSSLMVAAFRDGVVRAFEVGVEQDEAGRVAGVSLTSARTFDFNGPAGTDYSAKIARIAEPVGGPRLLAAGQNGRIGPRVWNLDTGELLAELPNYSRTNDPLAFSPDGRFLVIGGNEGKTLADGRDQTGRYLDRGGMSRLAVYAVGDLLALGDRAQPCTVVDGVFRVEYIAFNGDGTRLVTGHEDGSVQLWQVRHPGDR